MPILNPETVTAVGYADHGADIDTDRLVQNFAREARANGARIITDARVTAISAGPGGTGPWEVRVGDQAYTGRILVNAAGAWADQIARLAGVATLGLTPKRRSVARIAAPEGMDPSTWPMVFGADESWYCKPDAGALIVSPAEADPSEPHDAWADDMVLAEGIARYQDKVTAPVTRLLSSWAGLRTFAPDHCPVIGFAPGNPAFFWLAGQGGYGFQSAPATSALVAELIGGRAGGQDPALIASVSPARFMMGA
jgi:glycine/D-amino acid oxidase-like deaminating enzyme